MSIYQSACPPNLQADHLTIWFQKFCAFVNGIYDEQDLTPEVFKRVKQMFVRSFPYISRHLTTKERERVSSLLQSGILD